MRCEVGMRKQRKCSWRNILEDWYSHRKQRYQTTHTLESNRDTRKFHQGYRTSSSCDRKKIEKENDGSTSISDHSALPPVQILLQLLTFDRRRRVLARRRLHPASKRFRPCSLASCLAGEQRRDGDLWEAAKWELREEKEGEKVSCESKRRIES